MYFYSEVSGSSRHLSLPAVVFMHWVPILSRPVVNWVSTSTFYMCVGELGQCVTRSSLAGTKYSTTATGSTVGVQREDGRTWTLGTITEYSDHDHNGKSYRIWIMKLGKVVRRIWRYIRATPVSAKQYFQDQRSKQNDQYIYRDDIYQTITTKQKAKQSEHSKLWIYTKSPKGRCKHK